MIRARGLAFKLIVLLFISNAVLFSSVFLFNYQFARGVIEQGAEENARNLAQATVNRIETVLSSVEKVTASLASYLELTTVTAVEISSILRANVLDNSEIFGAAVAYQAGAFEPAQTYFAPYVFTKGDHLEQIFLGSDSSPYFNEDWYQIPMLLGRPMWSEPYYVEGSSEIMSTFSVPFYGQQGGARKIIGIVRTDVSLTWLTEIVSSVKIFESGYAFLISQNGTLVTSPEAGLVMNESIFSIAEGRGDQALREIGRSMIQGGSGFVLIQGLERQRSSWLAYYPLPSSGWSLGVVFPADELLANVTRLNTLVIVLAAVCFVILFLLILFISNSITRPLKALAKASEVVAGGNLDAPLPIVRSRDEVGQLAASFATMTSSLREYIRNLKETTAAKERIESELKIAHDIQMGMVPKIFPAFPDRQEFTIYAFMEPAKEVGGDFYDFLMIDPRHLCFLIGDVSGKGVPASLMMAVTITLFRAIASEGGGPGRIMTRLNNELVPNNEACMFVTAFCGNLDLNTGRLTFANAGHNPPYIVSPGEPPSKLTDSPDLVLGVVADLPYREREAKLKAGDFIITYTDGVTEAMRADEQMFSEERLEEALSGEAYEDPHQMVMEILARIRTFVAGQPPWDDITMLAVRYSGVEQNGESRLELRIPNQLAALEQVNKSLQEFTARAHFPPELEARVSLVLDEIITNVISYAFPEGGEHWIHIRLALDSPRQHDSPRQGVPLTLDSPRQGALLHLEIEDDGQPFNPLELEEPDLTLPIEERGIGGLGIFLVRKTAKRMEYHREGGHNLLSIDIEGPAPDD